MLKNINPLVGIDLKEVPSIAIKLGFDEFSREERAVFLLDYILLLEDAFHDVFPETNFEFDDLLEMANQLKLVVIDKTSKDAKCPF